MQLVVDYRNQWVHIRFIETNQPKHLRIKQMYLALNTELRKNLGPQLAIYLKDWTWLTEAQKQDYYKVQQKFNDVERLLQTYYNYT